MRLIRASAVTALLFCAAPALAYVGPGAGLAVVGGVWAAVLMVLAVVAVLLFPFRFAWHRWCDRTRRRKARARRVIVLGFDGLDAGLTRRFMAAGSLPHLQRLAEQGSQHDLRTVLPAITPAAWPTFATGVDPSGHAIFDFIARNPKTYAPELASAEISQGKARRFGAPRPRLRSKRRSRPFWEVLGEHRVFSTILRVPITWPPTPFRGLMLSGMSAPDLRGTQGEGTLLTTETAPVAAGPLRVLLRRVADRYEGEIPGPADPTGTNQVLTLQVGLTSHGSGATLELGTHCIKLACDEDSDWLPVTFGADAGAVHGMCRVRLMRLEPLELYVTPLQIDPLRPAMPISHPAPFAEYLARRNGRYATVGLAEDTDALNAGVIDEGAFLDQVESLHIEREAMLLDALARTRNGLVACVFDGSDRVQHMFYRSLETDHPANRRHDCDHADAVQAAYQRADETVARVQAELGPDDVLLVMSDHGFCSFRRGVDVNAWLLANGYLQLKPGTRGGPWLCDVDWSKTRAYALGLSGLYINLQGREGQGIVGPGQPYDSLKAELVQALTGLYDDIDGAEAIVQAYDTARHYDGPYAGEGPDILVGYAAGYRVSWGTARGEVGSEIFADNDRRWSGDHCVEPALVPGVLFSSIPLAGNDPGLADVPVTIMSLLGVGAPSYMQGQDLAAEQSV